MSVLVQLTDLHIGAPDGDPAADLRAVLAAVAGLRGDAVPDAVVVTGDLVDDGLPEQYAEVAALLGALDVPLHVLPGNHDDRAGLRAAFPLGPLDAGGPEAGPADAPYRYAVRCGGLRLVCCDTVVPGSPDGRFDAASAAWLDGVLAEDDATPTIVAMHHPPFDVGLPVLDPMALPTADRDGLAAVLARHRQVARVVCGHVHVAGVTALGGVPVMSGASAWGLQFRLDLAAPELRPVLAPPGITVHALVRGQLVSFVRPAVAV